MPGNDCSAFLTLVAGCLPMVSASAARDNRSRSRGSPGGACTGPMKQERKMNTKQSKDRTQARTICLMALLACGLAAPLVRADAVNTAATSGATDFHAPEWTVGDHWTVQEVQWNRLRASSEPMAAVSWHYCVVAQTQMDGHACAVVERWPQPIDPAFPLQHTVYYFRLPDLQVIRKLDWFYVQDELRGPARCDYAPLPGVPHVDPDGVWVPSFPAALDAIAPLSSAAALRDGRGQLVSQSLTPATWQSLAELSTNVAWNQAARTPATTNGAGVEFTITEGNAPGERVIRRQTWATGMPWFLHEQSEADETVIGEIWLVAFGQASAGDTVAPSDPLDLSSAEIPDLRATAAIAPNATLTERATAGPEPWCGCWWSFFDSTQYANLFDISSGDAWRPMKAYDDYFYPGETWAWSWEMHYHRETSSLYWWWGHCDAWSAAALRETKPQLARAPFNLGEMEGLLTECWYDFTIAYWYPSGAGVNDNVPMKPGALWRAVRDNIRGDSLGGVGRPIAMDLYSCPTVPSGTDQVWNHPVFAYSITYSLAANNRYAGTIVLTAEADTSSPITALHQSFSVTYGFTDVVITSGVVDPNSGVWTSSTWRSDPTGSGTSHYIYPDVAWYPGTRIGGNNVVEYSLVRGMIKIAPPSSLVVTASGGTHMLAWADNSANETGFSVERRDAGGTTWAPIATVGANVTSCLVPATTGSSYRVRAYNTADGYSLYSNEALVGGTMVQLNVNGASVTGTISPAGDADWFTFTVASPGTYTIDTQAGTLADNYMYLYGPNSQTALLAEDDDSGVGYAARIVRTLPVGTYYAKVRAYSASGTGMYTIRVTR